MTGQHRAKVTHQGAQRRIAPAVDGNSSGNEEERVGNEGSGALCKAQLASEVA